MVSPDSLSVWLTIPFVLAGAGVASLHTGPWATADGMEYRTAGGSTGGGSHWLYHRIHCFALCFMWKWSLPCLPDLQYKAGFEICVFALIPGIYVVVP